MKPVEKFGDYSKKLLKEFAGAPAPVKPVVKPGIKPSISPTRPPMPKVMPRPKAVAKAISNLLVRYNYLLRSGAGKAMQESIEGKGIPKDALDKIKSGFVRGGMGAVMSNGMIAHETAQKIAALEKSYDKSELENIAMEMVSSMFPNNGIGVDFSDLKWDISLIDQKEAERYKQTTDNPARKSKSISIYPDKTKDAIYKKRVMNMVTQGYAMKTQAYFFDEKAAETVDKLAPELVQNYMKFFKHSQQSSQAMPEGKELEDMLKSSPPQAFTGMMNIEVVGEDYVIKVRATNVFFLIHEMMKGVYEMMSLHGMQYDEKTTQAMVDESDTLFDEQYGFKYGEGLVDLFDKFYDRLETELIQSADIHEHSPSAKPALLALMYNQSELGDKQFLNMMELIFKGKPDANTITKAKALYMRVVQSSQDRAEMGREQDLMGGEDVDDVDLGDLDFALSGSRSPERLNEPDNNPQVDPQPEEEDEPSIDDVLDKISASGMGSLTPKERALLKSLEERRTVRSFTTFLKESVVKKSKQQERIERRISFLEKKLTRSTLSVNERALSEAELAHVKKRLK